MTSSTPTKQAQNKQHSQQNWLPSQKSEGQQTEQVQEAINHFTSTSSQKNERTESPQKETQKNPEKRTSQNQAFQKTRSNSLLATILNWLLGQLN
ncbi:hypothetical protein [Streptococcus sobrinus]|uniref:hypothetical protein n=1 Tax=Streptococcus sobrinus TaxID=1310 RepID=UPI0002F92CD6|nr:hypothetical protein [Streptococcus sobrinus]